MNRFRISTPEGTRDLLFSSCRCIFLFCVTSAACQEKGHGQYGNEKDQKFFHFANHPFFIWFY